MAVKVLIKREFEEGKDKEVYALFNKLRTMAMTQPGYISGETLQNAEAPQQLLVVATWHSVEDWINWQQNKQRKAEESRLAEYLISPAEYEIYTYAVYPFR